MRAREIVRTTYRVSDFVSWQRAGTLVLSPAFQRRAVWKPGAKSFFVDTLARGLPAPIIIVRERRSNLETLEPQREVVDGQQRLRTLFAYIDSSLLRDFDSGRDSFAVKEVHNKELAGKTFSELSSDHRQQLLDYEFSVHVLPAQTDDREVWQIFARLNATGVRLNDQELRNAGYFGEFKTAMYELATEQLSRWTKWKVFSTDNIARMEEVELTSEFALLMIKGITGKNQAALNKVYKDKDGTFPERREIERRFRTIMDAIEDRLGSELPHLSFRRKTLFYSLFAFLYDSMFALGSPLETKRGISLSPDTITRVKVAGERIENKTAPKEVLEAVARRTTHPSSRTVVINYLRSV